MPNTFRRLIVVQPRLFLAESILDLFRSQRLFHEILLAADVPSSIDLGARSVVDESDIVLFYLIGGISYFELPDNVQRINRRFPKAQVVVLDERPRHGCGYVVDQINIQGYLTFHESHHEFLQCLKTIVEGNAAMARSVEPFLEVAKSDKKLSSRSEIRGMGPHQLTHKEWLCFRHLVLGRDLDTLAFQLNLELRSAKNLKYRMLKKLEIAKYSDLLRVALQWGFVE